VKYRKLKEFAGFFFKTIMARLMQFKVNNYYRLIS